MPRYRQKLAFPPLEIGRPFWVDDPTFNLDYHVRHTALPKPGSDEQLRQLVGRIFSQRLDRSKPLWELWIVQGLEGDRFALISKTHHALVDGVSGVDIATVLFDLSPVPAEPEVDGPLDAGARALRRRARGRGRVKGLVRTPIGLAGRALGALRQPGRARSSSVREAAEGVGEVVWAGLNPAPDVPLNVPIGPHRRVRWVQSRLADFKEIKDALGGTVNDVVLAVVAGALAQLAARARRAHRGRSSCARWCPSRSAPRTSAARSATASPRCAGRCPCTWTTRSSACGSCARRWAT